MNSKIIEIPFRLPSSAGPFLCTDGEIESLANAIILNRHPNTSTDTTNPGDAANNNPANSGNSADSASGNPDNADTPGDAGSMSGSVQATDSPLAGVGRPSVEFALRRGVIPGWHNHPANFPSREMTVDKPSESAWGKCVLQLLADLEKDAAKASLLTSPFLVISAIRLSDGSHILPSTPVLLIPNSRPPMIAGSRDTSLSAMKLTAVMAACSLEWKISIPDDFTPSTIGMEALDIFISSPISLYDKKESPESCHNAVSPACSQSIDTDGVAGKHRISSDAFPNGWFPPAYDSATLAEKIRSVNSFHLISSVEIGNLKNSEQFLPVSFNMCALPSLDASEKYIPDFAHLSGMRANYRSRFSGRDTYTGLTMTLPRIPAPEYFTHFSGDETNIIPSRMAIEIETVKNGNIVRCNRCLDSSASIDESSFPSWLFYPDPDARKMRITTTESTFTIRLRPHPSLHGSYFWNGADFSSDVSDTGISVSPMKISPTAEIVENRGTWQAPADVWRSAKGNPFLLPDALLFNLNVDRVIAICRAYRSSGLVATTSPTAYLFTSEGIFLLKEMDDGTLRDAGLISRRILRDATSIFFYDDSLAFIATDGQTYIIRGTTVKQLSTSESSSSASKSQGAIVIGGDGSALPVKIATRPIKLGDAANLKRVLGVALWGRYERSQAHIRLFGSRNLTDWELMASSAGCAITGLWGSSCRFVRLEAEVSLRDGESLKAMVFKVVS